MRYMRNLELMKMRLDYQGGNSEGRIIREKLKSLEQALKYSYQAETIIKDGFEYRALINNNKLKMDYDDKIISIPFTAQMAVGDLFEWPRTNTKWITYLQIYSEDAYFRGYIRKADHTITWKDEYGNIHSTPAAIRGPVETKIRSQMKGGLAFDEPNYTLNAIIPNTVDTIKLQRYSKVTIDSKVWEVVATDSISESGVIDMGLIESYFNREEDTKEVVKGKVETEIIVNSSLDELTEAKVGQPINLWTDITVDGKSSPESMEDLKYIILEGFAKISNNQLTITNPTKVKILLDIPNLKIKKHFEITGVKEVKEDITDIDIVGDSNVKAYGTSTYKVVKHNNGEEVQADGIWNVNGNENLYRIANYTGNSIELRWTLGLAGEITLEFKEDVDSRPLYKKIKIESLI